MGNSLHNKIYLGRRPVMTGKSLMALAVVGAVAGCGLAWLLLRTYK
ncbi:hypothetical protein SAMN05880566_10335 [Janthinobacterium sp. TND4EL3]|nr:hypothetical protein [Janthinobacterium sp. TND4EL3]SIQ36940.1 hypothetical protein SAMN05880566_10335 [Janthinobacterium sp. TND4EL3]